MTQPKKVLVTGGAGFIGGHVAEAYLSQGHRVWIVDDLSSGKLTNLPSGAEFVKMDIGSPSLDSLFREVGGFDLVNHHAAQIDVRKSVADPRFDAKVNIDGLLNVADCAVRYGTGRFIFVSSGGTIYGETPVLPTPEYAKCSPRSPYAISKLTGENYLYFHHLMNGLDYVTLRYGNVYGPRQDPHGEAGVVAIFSNRILAGQPLTIFGTGEQTRDYVYVGDVVRANLLFSEAELPGAHHVEDRAFNIGTGLGTNVIQLATSLMEASEAMPTLQYAPARAGELQDTFLNCDKAREVVGWQPEVSLVEGLGRTFRFIEAARQRTSE